MHINRTNIKKELLPGLNAILLKEYDIYDKEDEAIFKSFTTDRAWEEEVLWTGFGAAPTKVEGTAVTYDSAREGWAVKYQPETVALAFALTEEAIEDNLYDTLATRGTRSLARSMAHTKQVKAANVINRATTSGYNGGDGVVLLSTAHPLADGSTAANRPTNMVDISEAAIEDAWIAIANFTDDRGIPMATQPRKLVIPPNLVFTVTRLLDSEYQPDVTSNSVNAVKRNGVFPEGWTVNHRLTDTDAWYILTDAPDGFKKFQRKPLQSKMEADFQTGNMRYKVRERYVYGWSNWRAIYGSTGA